MLRLGVAMLLLLPFIALALPALQIEAWAAPAPPAPLPRRAVPPLRARPGPRADPAYALPADAGLQPAEPTIWDDPTPLVLLAYLGGLLMVGSRLLAGLIMLGRWTRAARDVDLPGLAGRVRARPPGRAGRRKAAAAGLRRRCPRRLSWGWRRPVILIDPDTMAEPRRGRRDPRP